MAPTKQRGDQAELAVASDLVGRGYRVLIPFGEDCDYDLAIERSGRIERVQVKFVREHNSVLRVPGGSLSLTNGKVRRVKRYTAATIDWLAAYEPASKRCFYIPAAELGDGCSEISLRLGPTANNQKKGVRMAADYETLTRASATHEKYELEWSQPGSNRRPLRCKRSALPSELWPQGPLILGGIERRFQSGICR